MFAPIFKGKSSVPCKISFVTTMHVIQSRVLRLCISNFQICTRRLHPIVSCPASISNHKRSASSMSGPPKHEMVYFPNMTGALPASSSVFRKVLWTGLYSQVVLMTIPVGGDIGEEVRIQSSVLQGVELTSPFNRRTLSTKH